MKTSLVFFLSLMVTIHAKFFTLPFTSPCNENDGKAPCSCEVILTSLHITKEGKSIDLQFPEAVCNKPVNQQRKEKGLIPSFYKCVQMKSTKTIYRDAFDSAIEIPVSYRAGCEIRCLSPTCLKLMCGDPKYWIGTREYCSQYAQFKRVISDMRK